MSRLTLLNGRVPMRQRPEDGGQVLAEVQVGSIAVDDEGNFWRMLRNHSTGVITARDSVTYLNVDTTDYIATADVSASGAQAQARFAGIAGDLGTDVAVDEYFWAQIGGRALVNTETATPVVGDPVIVHASADGECDNGIETDGAAEHIPKYIGVFLAVEVSGTPDLTPVLLRGNM